MRWRTSPVTPADIEEAAAKTEKEHTVPEKKSSPYLHDHGPLRTYEITWMDGTKETVQGHSVVFDTSNPFDNRRAKARFGVYGDFDGHWRLALSGLADDVRSVRDVTPKPGQAVLTKEIRTPLTGNMEAGQVGYTVPWALIADMDERLWLKPDYTVSPEPHGTATLRVERRRSDYVVRVPAGETYAPSQPWQRGLLPVAAVETGKEKNA